MDQGTNGGPDRREVAELAAELVAVAELGQRDILGIDHRHGRLGSVRVASAALPFESERAPLRRRVGEAPLRSRVRVRHGAPTR